MADKQELATELEMGPVWHLNGCRTWRWFHDFEVESVTESGYLTILTGQRLYSSMYSRRAACWHHGPDEQLVLSFGNCHHYSVLESRSPPVLRVVRRELRDEDSKKRRLGQQPRTVGFGVEVLDVIEEEEEQEGVNEDHVQERICVRSESGAFEFVDEGAAPQFRSSVAVEPREAPSLEMLLSNHPGREDKKGEGTAVEDRVFI